jgi:hypothetical protein
LASGAERFGRGTVAIAIVAALVAGAAAWMARHSRPPTETVETSSRSRLPRAFVRVGRFWIGAWCAPPSRATTAAAWTRFAEAGIDVGLYPLEDRYRREDNFARLALLDSLNAARPGARRIFAIVRDDSLHPDETLRNGWKGRAQRVQDAYRPYASCAGIFLADEPGFETLPWYGPIARELRPSPSEPLSPFVNYAGMPAHATLADRARWRQQLVASVREAQLSFFTVDSYAAPSPGGEWPNFLLSLLYAANVASETGIDFGYLIQVTGHGPFPPATPGQARMRVFESLAHGARAIIWFTYWTPNPDETPWRWHEGMVDYATGEPTGQYAMVRAVNAEARRCAEFFGVGANDRVAHLGGGLPAGADEIAAHGTFKVPGLTSARGGPMTIAHRAVVAGSRRLLVVNRDVAKARTFELAFDPELVQRIEATTFDDRPDAFESPRPHEARLRLPPGGAIGLELSLSEPTAARRP